MNQNKLQFSKPDLLVRRTILRTNRYLSVTPNRVIERLDYVPPGRSLHLLDVENLMGGPKRGVHALEFACNAYRETGLVACGDHITMAANPHLIHDAVHCWPGAKSMIGKGPDGADRALINAASNVEWVARRFDRIVIGSGDGIFHRLARRFRALGIEVGVVARVGSLAYILRRQASFVRQIPDGPDLRSAA
ncbi:NYN domain-containing protein [Candidatus Palauibacter sp.]|uniref:NYN domain-containing protein n=1 Tax=Candidatus Palauibacter sp. TaxID=3101350 RepID=UPI003B5BB92B